jgi:hypothetical protein
MSRLPELSAIDLQTIEKLPRELWFTAFIVLSKSKQNGHVISNLRGFAAKVDFRDLQEKRPRLTRAEKKAGKVLPPIVLIPLDDDSREDTYSFAERLAAASPEDTFDGITALKSRMEKLDAMSECALDVLRAGNRAMADAAGITIRGIQKRNKRLIERVAGERKFKNGEAGQGSLFGFDGEVQS